MWKKKAQTKNKAKSGGMPFVEYLGTEELTYINKFLRILDKHIKP